MAKSKKQKPANKKLLSKKEEKTIQQEETITPFLNATESLMPELEELVKKNPNRLIGCGG